MSIRAPVGAKNMLFHLWNGSERGGTKDVFSDEYFCSKKISERKIGHTLFF